MITLTPDQEKALKEGVQWWKEERQKKQVWTLSGISGAGKTTIASYILEAMKVKPREVLTMAYTGAAVQVLLKRGIQAQTIHQSIYNFEIVGKKIYQYRKSVEDMAQYKLFVVDEASMVSQELLDDLLSFGKPIMLIGDGNQLPPVGGTENYFIQNPDFRLTQPVRQALESPIVLLAYHITQGVTKPKVGWYGKEVLVTNKLNIDHFMQVEQVITRTNKDRIKFNSIIRNKNGFSGEFPRKGEKLVCKKNNWSKMQTIGDVFVYLVNGLRVTAESDFNDSLDKVKVKPILPGSDHFVVDADPLALKEEQTNWMEYRENIDLCAFQYGYAVTGHAMQGSEADTILFKNAWTPGTEEDNIRWLYTTLTRAKRCAVWVI